MSRIVVAAPPDSVRAAVVARLAAGPEAPEAPEVVPLDPPAAGGGGAARGADRQAAWAERLGAGPIAVVVYRPPRLAGPRSGRPDLADADAFFRALAAGSGRAVGPAKVVLISSSAVYEPSHRHPGRVAESWPAAARAKNPIARAWIALEALAAEVLKAAGLPAPVVLRAVPVAAPDGGDLLARLAARRLAVRVAGHDPAVQALDPDDLAEAVVRAAARGVAGERYHAAPAGAMPVRLALRAAGAGRLPLPHILQVPARAALARLGRAAPAAELAYVRFPTTVSAAKSARELGFRARRSTAEALARVGEGGSGLEGGRGAPPPNPLPATVTAPAEPDPFGFDRDYVDFFSRTLFRFLERVWWRIEVAGLEHLPRRGRAVLAGVHRGFMPWDGAMTLHVVAQAIDRYPRFLIHPCLVKPSYLADYMTRLGGILACRENADWVLGRDEILGMYPEGISGAFTPYRRAYRLGRFGGDAYVKAALRNRAPIVPFVTVGSAEIFPILGRVRWRWFQRWSEWPYLPLTPTFPLAPVPLPSKWHLRFLPPLDLAHHPPEAADDAATVAAISAEVRARMEAAIAEMLRRRRRLFLGVFRGSIFAAEETAPADYDRLMSTEAAADETAMSPSTPNREERRP